MLTSNPFSDISLLVSAGAMQTYVVVMVILVVAGTIFDVIHKKSARYFFENAKKSEQAGERGLGGGEKAAIAARTLAEDVLTSAEFCNPRRRAAHLLTMYGFIIYVACTAVLVFCPNVAGATATLWHLGALMVCVGGYWFWFFIRVDVAAEGHSPFRVVRADLFILSLLASCTLALIWSVAQSGGVSAWSNAWFFLYILATTVLFAGVPWSKFAHMFFKPAAAYGKRLSEANGARDNLPPPVDQPEKFGLGIKRELPRHY